MISGEVREVGDLRASMVAQTIRICLSCRRLRFDPWVQKIPWRREWQLTPVFLPGEFHGQKSLAGYSPWSRKESNTTEWLTLSLSSNICPGVGLLNDMVVLYLVFKGASIMFIKKSKIMPFAATWMDLEIIILSEVSQRKTNTM